MVILGKTAYLQQMEGGYWRSMSDSLHQKFQVLQADRGTIFSEDGEMLSTSIPQFDIYIDFMADGLRAKQGKIFKENIDSFAIALANFFGDKPADTYKAELKKGYKNKKRYYPLCKKMSFDDYRAFRQLPLVKLGRNKSGIIAEESSRRLMPYGLLANRTIGLSREYTESDGEVKKMNVGLEKTYDTILSGKNGQRLVRYAAGGVIPVQGFDIAPENGKDVYTTLDVTIQDIAQNALYKYMDSSKAQFGTCIIMEVKTGKIKAMANLGADAEGNIRENDNYAIKLLEPGSTVKLATLLAVLDKGTFNINDKVTVGSAGRMQVGPRIVTDAERQHKPVLTVKEVFAHSSNVGFGKLGFQAFSKKPEEYKKYLDKFYLTKRAPVDLVNIPKPGVAPLERKNGGAMNLVTMSFGYALMVSPLNTLMLYNAVANGGKMMKPYLVTAIKDNGNVIKLFEPEVLDEKIAKPEVIAAAQESMVAVVTEGTARKAMAGLPFAVAGKTGTAHVADGKIKYSDGVYHASFAGYFPANNPQYSCIVVFRTKPGRGFHFGGVLAAPVFKEVASKMYSLYVNKKQPGAIKMAADSTAFRYAGYTADVKRVYNMLGVSLQNSNNNSAGWSMVTGYNYQPRQQNIQIDKNTIPDVNGMGLKDALYLLETMGLKVMVLGSGKVKSQSLQPGAVLRKGSLIKLQLG